jgi:hypothetical protein
MVERIVLNALGYRCGHGRLIFARSAITFPIVLRTSRSTLLQCFSVTRFRRRLRMQVTRMTRISRCAVAADKNQQKETKTTKGFS